MGLSLVIVAAFAWLMNRGGLPFLPPKGTLSRLDTPLYCAFVAGLAIHLVSRYWRYRFLIAPVAKVSDRRVVCINAIALALITFLPLRVGEVAKPALLRERGRLSAIAIAGTVAAERILDGVVFSVAILVGLAFATPHTPLPDHIGTLPVPAALVPRIASIASVGFGIAFVIMATFYWFRSFARAVTRRIVGVVSADLAERVAGMVESLSDGLQFLTMPRYAVPFLVVTVLGVVAEAWGLKMLGAAVGIPGLTLAQTTVATGVLALGFALPNAPGFFGAVQIALYAGLAVYVAPAHVVHEGAAMVFLFYVTYVAEVLCFAAVALLVEYRFKPAAAPQSEMP
jgi:hypothetical protein